MPKKKSAQTQSTHPHAARPRGVRPHAAKEPLQARLEVFITENVKPFLAMHGGDVVLESVSPEGVVHLTLHGACHGCGMAAITFQLGVERLLMEKFPDEVTGLTYA